MFKHMKTKVCTVCNNEKPLDDFYRASRMSDGRQSRCKVCMRGSYNASRDKKKDHYNEVLRKRRTEKVEKFRELKESIGCHFCEETFAPCLEMHHLFSEEKEFELSTMVSRDRNWDAIFSEMGKCVVLCANCHRKVHYGVLKIE